jgi:hypothetical protein
MLAAGFVYRGFCERSIRHERDDLESETAESRRRNAAVFAELATKIEASSSQRFVNVGFAWYALCIRRRECNQATSDEQLIASHGHLYALD